MMMARGRKVRYGPSRHQHAVLYRPSATERPPTVVLIHGGFWKWPYGRWVMRRLVSDVRRRGWCAFDIEYRRLGRFGGGGGWPNTFDDVTAALARLAEADVSFGVTLDLDRVALFGHSAGAQLAVWAAATGAIDTVGVVAAAGPLDLERLVANGSPAVEALLAGADPAHRFALTSPTHMLPIGVPIVCVHGAADTTVDPATSTAFVTAARAVGDDASEVVVDGAGHRAVLDPSSAMWLESVAAIERWFGEP